MNYVYVTFNDEISFSLQYINRFIAVLMLFSATNSVRHEIDTDFFSSRFTGVYSLKFQGDCFSISNASLRS